MKHQQAVRHKNQAKYLLSLVSAKIDACREELGKALDRKLKCKTWKANTVRTYVSSLALFVRFLLAVKGLGQLKCYNFSSDGLHALQATMSNWIKNLTKLSQRDAREATKNLTEDDIVNPMISPII